MKNNEPYYIEIRPYKLPFEMGRRGIIWLLIGLGVALVAVTLMFDIKELLFNILFFVVGGFGLRIWASQRYTRFYRTYFENNSNERVYFENVKDVVLKKDEKMWGLKFVLGKEMFYFVPLGREKDVKVFGEVQELLTAFRERRTPRISPKYDRKI